MIESITIPIIYIAISFKGGPTAIRTRVSGSGGRGDIQATLWVLEDRLKWPLMNASVIEDCLGRGWNSLILPVEFQIQFFLAPYFDP
jgi:hypothetical protein